MKQKFINTPEEEKIIDIDYWTKKMSDISKHVLEEHQKNHPDGYSSYINKKRNKKTKSLKDFNIFEFASKEVLLNEDLMLKAIENGFIYYHNLQDELKNSKNFALRYVKENKNSYYFSLPENMLLEDNIFELCLRKDPKTYTSIYYNHELSKKYSSKEQALKFLDINSSVYEFLGDSLKNELSIAKKAIDLDIMNVKFMKKQTSAKIFIDASLCQKLLEKDSSFFIKINNKFRDDEEFVIPFLKSNPTLIEFLSNRLKNKREIVKIAAKAYNLLENICEEFKKDPELMELHLSSVISHHWEIKKYQDIKPLIFNILKNSYYNYDYLPSHMKEDPDYIYAVLLHDGFYKKTKDNPSFYSTRYEKVTMLQILPEALQQQLTKEFMEEYPQKQIYDLTEKEREEVILSYARNKYTNMYLKKHLKTEDEQEKIKKFKI